MSFTIAEAVEQAAKWADLDGVELVAQGQHKGQDCIVVHVSLEDVAARLPATIGGYPVVVKLSGKIVAQNRDREGLPK